MANILDQVRMTLERLISLHFPWCRWGQQYLRRVLDLGNFRLMRIAVAHLEPNGTDCRGEEEEEAGAMMAMKPQNAPLPDVGTLARVWADEQAAQAAEKTIENLLSCPIRIKDVCVADHSMPSTALLALFTPSLGDEGESLQLRRLWVETVVWDDSCQGW